MLLDAVKSLSYVMLYSKYTGALKFGNMYQVINWHIVVFSLSKDKILSYSQYGKESECGTYSQNKILKITLHTLTLVE